MLSKSMPAVAAAVVLLAWSVACADVPKPGDMAACNKQAEEAVRAGSSSPSTAPPTTKDTGRAAQARRGDASTDRADTATRSSDPQLEGMDPEGAKDPVFQAAYRTCMRKSGF
jgi:hypothetical protein